MSKKRSVVLVARLLALSLGLGTCVAGSWGFKPTADLMERYDNNVGLDSENAVADFITRIGGDLPLRWSGERSRFDLSYRFGYDAYLENRDLNNLSQYARIGWGMDDTRNRGDIFFSWGRTENPRVGIEQGAEVPPTPGADTGFLVTRTRTDYWLLSTGYARSLSSDWSLRLRLDGSAARYEEPQLADNRTYTLVLEGDYRASARNAWKTGLRYSIYDADGFPAAGFSAVQGGAAHQITRRFGATWLLGVVLKQDTTLDPGEEELVGEALSGTDRLYGSAAFNGSYRRSRWSFGYTRDFTSGSGVRVAVRRDQFAATAGWDVGRSGGIGVALSRSRNQGRDLDVNSDALELRYSHAIRSGWSFQLAADARQQDGNDDGGAGTFREDVYSVMFRYGGQRRS